MLDISGDHVNRDWGYQYLAAIPNADNTFASRVGSFSEQRTAFVSTGSLPATPDNRQPRAASDSMPTMAITADFKVKQGQDGSMVVMVAYDDIASVSPCLPLRLSGRNPRSSPSQVKYYGNPYKAFWTQTYTDIFAAMAAAAVDFPTVVVQGQQVEDALWQATSASAGPK